MPLTPRAVLGNSLGGGLWKDASISEQVPASGNLDIDTIPEDGFLSAYYIITAWTATRTKTLMFGVVLDNGSLLDSVFAKIGKGLPLALSATLAAGTITVNAATSGIDPVDISVIRLITKST